MSRKIWCVRHVIDLTPNLRAYHSALLRTMKTGNETCGGNPIEESKANAVKSLRAIMSNPGTPKAFFLALHPLLRGTSLPRMLKLRQLSTACVR